MLFLARPTVNTSRLARITSVNPIVLHSPNVFNQRIQSAYSPGTIACSSMTTFPATTPVLIAMGSNSGDRAAHLAAAVQQILALPDTRVLRFADAIETAPVDCPPGSAGFLNSALLIETTLQPRELFAMLQQIERDAGRIKTTRNAPRTIDLDVLLFGDHIINDADFVVPHPRMLERAFVLIPAAQIAPDMRHPQTEMSLRHALERLVPSSLFLVNPEG